MKIVFDVSSCAKTRRKGIANYGVQLVRACAAVAPEHDIGLAVRGHRWLKKGLVDDILPGRKVHLLTDLLGGATLGAPDLVHGVGVRLPKRGAFAKTFTLHDLNVLEFPELSTPEWRETRRRRIEQTVARADLVLSVSEQGRRSIHEHLGVPLERIRAVPEGVDLDHFRRPDDETIARVSGKFGLADLPYVICIGTPDLRKNHDGLLDAFVHAQLPDPWRLVLGGPKEEQQAALRTRWRAAGLPDERLVFPGWIEDDELPALLAGCAFYVCASMHEGFGLPVLEAQACGAPVASSDRAALPETLGDCGLLFDPTDLDAFAAALVRLAGDADMRADLARRGPERVAREFSWETVARRTLAVFEEAVAVRAG